MEPTHSIPHSAFVDFSRRFCVSLTAVLRRKHEAVSSGQEGAAGEKIGTHDNDLPVGLARSHRFGPSILLGISRSSLCEAVLSGCVYP